MSDETSLARAAPAGYAAFNETGDPSGILAELDPDVELVVSMGGPEGTLAFRGHDGIAEWAREMGDVWRDITFEPLEVESDPAGRAGTRGGEGQHAEGRASDLGLEGMESARGHDLGRMGRSRDCRGSPTSMRREPPSRAPDPGL